jgi:hypothetical protein
LASSFLATHFVKNIFLFSILMLSGFCSFGVNRIASDWDRQIYGTYITSGDLIIDTPTKVTPSGNELIYYFMKKQWPALREGGTIWLDGEKLGKLSIIKFCNTASPLEPWHVATIKFRNIPGTQGSGYFIFLAGTQKLRTQWRKCLSSGACKLASFT